MASDDDFGSLDFLYTPSEDVAAEARYFTEVLGGRLLFAIEDGETRVAMIEIGAGAPRVLLADHLEGERAILVYRVKNLRTSLKSLKERGWEPEQTFEIPQGPCCSFTTPGGHRIALYELKRPEVGAHFEGRFDFSV